MRSIKQRFIIVQLFVFLILLFHATPYAGQPPDSAEAAVAQAIYQVKTVLIRRLAPDDIEEMINRVRDMGVSGYKLNQYSNGKMGWSIEDSKGREVHSIIFSFRGGQAHEGTYFGPLMSSKDAKVLHNWHSQVMSDYFTLIGAGKYDIEDNCIATMVVFKGTTGLGRTIITVECH